MLQISCRIIHDDLDFVFRIVPRAAASEACRLRTSSLHCNGSRDTTQRLLREGFISSAMGRRVWSRSDWNLDSLVTRDHAHPEIEG
jgi:hypothetical protein